MPKQTLLYNSHIELGAKMIDFNGWEMPVQYKTGIIAEHKAVREAAGIFDTCHMGEFVFTAPDVRKALNSLLPGDFSNVKNGRMRYSFITDTDGTVIDDAVIFIVSDAEAMICVNAGDIEGDFDFLSKNIPDNALLVDQSESTGKIDIQGPDAYKVVQKLTGLDFREMPFYSFIITEWQGGTLFLSRSGYTGSQGAELFIDADTVGQLWYYALEAGKEFGMLPCGLGARDTLRLEAGLPLYGHELDRSVNPLQAGFERFVSLDKEEDFPGKAALCSASDTDTEKLVGLAIADRRVPREGFAIKESGVEVGRVTSGGPAPFVGGNIALGYLQTELANIGQSLMIDIRGKEIPAVVAELPFYKCENLRKKV